jgi:hypothetical protein
MSLKGPLVATVGIRQVRADGVKLDEAMVLDVVGAPITNETTDDNLNSYKLDLTGLATDAALDTLTSTVSALTSSVTVLSGQLTALLAKQWTTTPIKVANYTAASWQHVLVDLGGLVADVTIAMPASPAVGDRVRVTEISTDGGFGNGRTLHVSCTFVTATGGGYWASSPHPVAYSVGDGGSLKGASIELLYTAGGWIIVSETAQVSALI